MSRSKQTTIKQILVVKTFFDLRLILVFGILYTSTMLIVACPAEMR